VDGQQDISSGRKLRDSGVRNKGTSGDRRYGYEVVLDDGGCEEQLLH
jgi:hypothetical protein